MSNKIQNLKPDTVLKSYWRNNKQFADLFNAILFDGKTVIKPEELKDVDTEESSVLYVNDYKILLVEARCNNLVLHNINNINLFNLLEIILDGSTSKNEAKKKAIKYSEEHPVDKSVVMTVAGATNSKIDYNAFEKGEVTMCTLFEEIAKESEARGKAIGEAKGRAWGIIESGFDFELSENDILVRLQKKMDISLQQAQEYMYLFKKQTI